MVVEKINIVVISCEFYMFRFFICRMICVFFQNKYLPTHVFVMRLPMTDEHLLFEFVERQSKSNVFVIPNTTEVFIFRVANRGFFIYSFRLSSETTTGVAINRDGRPYRRLIPRFVEMFRVFFVYFLLGLPLVGI